MDFNEWVYVISTLLLIPVIIYALITQYSVSSTFRRAQKIAGSGGWTGAQIAEKLMKAAAVNARVEQSGGRGLSDHYDPKRKVVALSSEVYNGTDVGALGVAAHEVGHAIQDETGYPPLKIRNAIIPFCNIVNKMLFPLIVIGIIVDIFIGMTVSFAIWVVLAAVIIYTISTLINLLTLPTEFNASKRAIELLEASGAIAGEQEKREVKRVLNAAANTYVAALAVSILQLIRLLAMLSSMRGRK